MRQSKYEVWIFSEKSQDFFGDGWFVSVMFTLTLTKSLPPLTVMFTPPLTFPSQEGLRAV